MTVDIVHQKASCVFMSVVIKHYEGIIMHYECGLIESVTNIIIALKALCIILHVLCLVTSSENYTFLLFSPIMLPHFKAKLVIMALNIGILAVLVYEDTICRHPVQV